MVRGSNPAGGGWDFLHPSTPGLGPTQPPIQCVLCLSPRGNVSRAWRWLPTPPSAKVKERVQLCLYLPSGSSLPVLGWTLPFCLYPCIWLPFRQHKIWLLLQMHCVTSVAILTSCSCSWSCCNCCSFISSWAAKERLLSASSRAWRNRLHLSRSRSSRSVESCCIDASCSRICEKALYIRVPSVWHWWDQKCAGYEIFWLSISTYIDQISYW